MRIEAEWWVASAGVRAILCLCEMMYAGACGLVLGGGTCRRTSTHKGLTGLLLAMATTKHSRLYPARPIAR